MKKQGLSKSERVKKKNDFEKVYKFGTTIFSSDKKFKATYFFDRTTERGLVKAAFAVHRRAGKAVWRNRIKRLFRESFRFNKTLLYDSLDLSGGTLYIIFSLNFFNEKKFRKVNLTEVIDPVIELMRKIIDNLKTDA